MIYLKTSLEKALAVCVLPFLLGDIIKMNVVYFLAPIIRKTLQQKSV